MEKIQISKAIKKKRQGEGIKDEEIFEFDKAHIMQVVYNLMESGYDMTIDCYNNAESLVRSIGGVDQQLDTP